MYWVSSLGLITAGSKVFQGVKTFLVEIMTSVVQSFDLDHPWRDEDGTPEVHQFSKPID